MVCTHCQKTITNSDLITCRGYCGNVFHAICVEVDYELKDQLGLHEKNVFWMCDDCANLFANGHFRNIVTHYDGNYAGITDSLNGMKKDIAFLNSTVKELSTKVDSKQPDPLTPLGPNRWQKQLNGNLKPGSAKRRRTDDTATERPSTIKGTKSTACNSVRYVPLEDDLLWVYLSAFAPSTTEDDIATLARECLSLREDEVLKVVKLVRKNADISNLRFVTFKIGIDKMHRDLALAADSWPENVNFREFSDDRTKNVTRITRIRSQGSDQPHELKPPDAN